MTVRVRPGDTNTTVELLCVVRALLKKMRERVLVGDFVRVISIDWIDMRGESALQHLSLTSAYICVQAGASRVSLPLSLPPFSFHCA